MTPRLWPGLLLLVLVLVALIVPPLAFYRSVPTGDTSLTHFDTLIVLGYPCNDDGSSSPEQRERVLEAVREFRRGVAPAMILSGGAAHNRFAESVCMANLALAQGVPPAAVIQEDQAQNTVQNLFYSDRILLAHHWNSAEVVSSPSHLPRAALILQHYPFAWHTHPAHWPHEYSLLHIALTYLSEVRSCWQIHRLGFTPGTPFPPPHSPANGS